MQTTSPFFSVWTKRSTLDNLKRISCFLRCKAAHIVIHQELKQNRKVHSSIIVCYLVRYINKASKYINIYIYVCMQFFFLQNAYDCANKVTNWNKIKSPISSINSHRCLTKKHTQTILCSTPDDFSVQLLLIVYYQSHHFLHQSQNLHLNYDH